MLNAEKPDLDGRHALIIEDEFVVGMDVQTVLADMGFTSFAFASTVGQALELGMLRRPDLITADMNLLDGDGFSATRELQAAHGRLPIVYVTGDLEAVWGLGDVEAVLKPFDPAALAAACERSLNATHAASRRPV